MEYSYATLNISKYFTINYMKKIIRVMVCFDLELEAPKLVLVKAHKRILQCKVVKVRSHYRRVWVRE